MLELDNNGGIFIIKLYIYVVFTIYSKCSVVDSGSLKCKACSNSIHEKKKSTKLVKWNILILK